MPAELHAGQTTVEIVERVPLVVSLRDGRDVLLVEGTAAEMLSLAQALRSVVEIVTERP